MGFALKNKLVWRKGQRLGILEMKNSHSHFRSGEESIKEKGKGVGWPAQPVSGIFQEDRTKSPSAKGGHFEILSILLGAWEKDI